ncbi:NAD(P)/FAD-dependent oxidoreductase [Occallatibacter riparius]|uniref:FAD-binding oxidoreductase n=1 Tax=Occallatibacter riparius TaxID=1002689 RepID=A0A9J7BG05_9BACT|nr:FAD-dependent oxidoreductase [Occallatibacter riparius]UWZ81704.1 FAD-binding oxidoreductase [Occallatibacter riparius]
MTMAASSFDVIIAGGGIVGAACAAACARQGMRVALVERDVLGSGATAAGMGHIVVMDDSDAQFALTRYSQLLWHALSLKLPASCEYEQRGTLWIAADDEEMAEAERKHAFYTARNVPAVLLNAQQLAQRESNLRSGLAGALLVPDDAVAYPPTVALHLAHEAQQHGATLIVGRSISRMANGEAVLDDGSHLKAPRLLNATGAWSPQFDADIPVKKRKGHLVITDRYPNFVRHQLVELGYLKSAHSIGADSVAFNVQPRSTGQVLIGSSRQYGNEDPAVDQHMITAVLQRAALYMPSLQSMSAIRVWTGFRAATPDKLPLIGPSTADDSVWLATGHEGLGITTSLGTAELIVASFSGKQPPIAPDPYLPSRYKQSTRYSEHHKEPQCNGKA